MIISFNSDFMDFLFMYREGARDLSTEAQLTGGMLTVTLVQKLECFVPKTLTPLEDPGTMGRVVGGLIMTQLLSSSPWILP